MKPISFLLGDPGSPGIPGDPGFPGKPAECLTGRPGLPGGQGATGPPGRTFQLKCAIWPGDWVIFMPSNIMRDVKLFMDIGYRLLCNITFKRCIVYGLEENTCTN